MRVVKRDGREVGFDDNKVINAITKANKEVLLRDSISEEEILLIVEELRKTGKSKIGVEEIQDIIEEILVDKGKYALAKKYILYRYNRALIRKANSTDESILSLIDNTNEEVQKENSNKNATILSTQRDLIAGEVSKDLAKRVLLPKRVVDAHEQGILHFHDMDYFIQKSYNCCLVDIKNILDNGTVMNGKMVDSPKSFQVACTVATQVIAAVASSQFGQSLCIAY